MNREETKEIAGSAAKAAVEASGPPTRVILRVIIIILAVLLVLWVIVKLTGVILLLVLSIFFAYLVSPLVEFLRRPIHIRDRTLVMPRVLGLAVSAFCLTIIFVLAVDPPRSLLAFSAVFSCTTLIAAEQTERL